MRWNFENSWKVLKWCLLSVLLLYLMVSSNLNWCISPIMQILAIFSCLTYILHRRWLKITFCVFPKCSTPQKKLKFTGKLSLSIRMISWNFRVGYIFQNQVGEQSVLARSVNLTVFWLILYSWVCVIRIKQKSKHYFNIKNYIANMGVGKDWIAILQSPQLDKNASLYLINRKCCYNQWIHWNGTGVWLKLKIWIINTIR